MTNPVHLESARTIREQNGDCEEPISIKCIECPKPKSADCINTGKNLKWFIDWLSEHDKPTDEPEALKPDLPCPICQSVEVPDIWMLIDFEQEVYKCWSCHFMTWTDAWDKIPRPVSDKVEADRANIAIDYAKAAKQPAPQPIEPLKVGDIFKCSKCHLWIVIEVGTHLVGAHCLTYGNSRKVESKLCDDFPIGVVTRGKLER